MNIIVLEMLQSSIRYPYRNHVHIAYCLFRLLLLLLLDRHSNENEEKKKQEEVQFKEVCRLLLCMLPYITCPSLFTQSSSLKEHLVTYRPFRFEITSLQSNNLWL